RIPSASSPEAEGVRLDARIEELDLEATVVDGTGLSDQLVHPLLVRRPAARGVDVGPVGSAGRFPVEEDPEPDGLAAVRRPHDQIEISGMKAIGDAATGAIE